MTPLASSNSRVSSSEKRRSGPRISVSAPASRSRCSPSPTSSRVASTTRSAGGRPARKRSSRPQRLGRAQLVQVVERPARRAAPASAGRTAAARRPPRRRRPAWRRPAPPARPRRPRRRAASTTESQKRCASRSPRSTDTQATRSASPSDSTQERSSAVLPLPAGAHRRTTSPGPSAPTAGRTAGGAAPARARPAGAPAGAVGYQGRLRGASRERQCGAASLSRSGTRPNPGSRVLRTASGHPNGPGRIT